MVKGTLQWSKGKEQVYLKKQSRILKFGEKQLVQTDQVLVAG